LLVVVAATREGVGCMTTVAAPFITL
jgi:hypothetical protein